MKVFERNKSTEFSDGLSREEGMKDDSTIFICIHGWLELIFIIIKVLGELIMIWALDLLIVGCH
jgi:hypothetical protein